MDATLTSGLTPLMARLAHGWLAESAVDPRVGQIVLAPHQVEAVARLRSLLRDYGGAVLADETGMGKTYVALAVARDCGPCHVVAPAGLHSTWAQALRRTGVSGRFVSFERLSRAGGGARERHKDASERQRTAEVRQRGAGDREQGAIAPAPDTALVIVDEAHHVRNAGTRRHDALARLVWGTPVLLLTATPVHNRLRDLRSQLALFLGSAADSLGAADLARLVVRRRHDALTQARRLPAVEPVHWLGVDAAPDVLRAIVDLPPPVPPSDGGTAHALLRLGLVRAWSSSHAALRATLRHRLHRATALTAAFDAGRFPTQAELRAWSVVDDALQLAFPELTASTGAPDELPELRDAVAAHVQGIRRIQDALDAAPDLDAIRADHLRTLCRRHAGIPIVAFTHFAETANGLGRRLAGEPGVAVVTARWARIASGRVSRQEIIARL
ncbi:MAG TPA: SNF2-related protein, partial [Gemmatimonadaceae bacterium]